MKRKAMPRNKDRKNFRKKATKLHRKNLQSPRGGYRL